MSTTPLDLRVGDEVKLMGPDWGPNIGKIVRVDRIDEFKQAWSNKGEIGSLTALDLQPYSAHSFCVEKVVTTEPAKPATPGYTLSLYVSKTAAAEFPGETQELASITIAHDDLELLLRKGKGILEVVADG